MLVPRIFRAGFIKSWDPRTFLDGISMKLSSLVPSQSSGSFGICAVLTWTFGFKPFALFLFFFVKINLFNWVSLMLKVKVLEVYFGKTCIIIVSFSISLTYSLTMNSLLPSDDCDELLSANFRKVARVSVLR